MNETQELMARVLAGDGRKVDSERLAELLRNDPALRAEFARLAMMEGQLGVALEDDADRDWKVRQITEALRRADREQFVSNIHSRVKRRWWLTRIAWGAVFLLIAGWAFFWLHSGNDSKVAVICRLETVQWGTGHTFRSGHALSKGDLIEFESGLAELEFNGRGRMIVEGPAKLEMAGADRIILNQGRIVMRVTPAGHGFQVVTLRGNVIDLGTEFGVSVDERGTVETHVLDGQIETVAIDGTRATLDRNDALRLDATGEKRIESDPGQFYTAMPPVRTAASGFIHWSLDERSGVVARARSEGLDAANADMALKKMDRGNLPVWIPGAQGTALAFDGKGSYAESGFLGIGGGQPRTVAFWLKVPKDFSLLQGFGILSWGKFAPYRPGEVWQVSINPIAEEGPVGRLRVGLHKGQVVGSTDLRDGRWHHVAVVLYGGSQPNVGTHVLLYVDGQLETVSRRALREVHTEIERADHGVWLGRNVTYTEESRSTHIQGGFFRGDIDELFIFDSALNQEDILKLVRKEYPTQ